MAFDSYKPAAHALQEVIFEKDNGTHSTDVPYNTKRSGSLIQFLYLCSLVDAAENRMFVPASGSRLLES